MKREIITNKNSDYVALIRDKLKANDGYCPCRLEKNEDTKCMCLDFRTQIEEGRAGECHCGLYEVVIYD